MSRPQKMHKPLKFSFTEIINAVADGRGVKRAKNAARSKNMVNEAVPPKKQ
jgi:hypothetical protein